MSKMLSVVDSGPRNRAERRHPELMGPRAYSIIETARLLGVSRALVYGLLRDGRLRSVAIGPRRRVIPAASLAELLDGTQVSS